MMALARAAPQDGQGRALLVAIALLAPLFAVALIPGYFDPTISWRGYADYNLAKYGRFVFMAVYLWIEIWSLYQLALCSGRIGLVYGGDRNGEPWIGSWSAAWLFPWRRLRCAQGMRVELQVLPRVPPGIFDRSRIVVKFGGRRRRLQVLSALDESRLSRLESWLLERGITGAVSQRRS